MKISNEHKNLYNKLDLTIKSILLISEGWLVGGSIKELMEGKTPKDFDIVVPDPLLWMKLISYGSGLSKIKPNSYGGIKFWINGIEYDTWSETLDHFLINSKDSEYIYNFKRNLLYKLI